MPGLGTAKIFDITNRTPHHKILPAGTSDCAA
jgi:hypothetical protein